MFVLFKKLLSPKRGSALKCTANSLHCGPSRGPIFQATESERERERMSTLVYRGQKMGGRRGECPRRTSANASLTSACAWRTALYEGAAAMRLNDLSFARLFSMKVHHEVRPLINKSERFHTCLPVVTTYLSLKFGSLKRYKLFLFFCELYFRRVRCHRCNIGHLSGSKRRRVKGQESAHCLTNVARNKARVRPLPTWSSSWRARSSPSARPLRSSVA